MSRPNGKAELSHRERVRLALEHQVTDRVPVATVSSGINPPALRELETYLARERGLTVDEYLLPINDIVYVGPDYIGPPQADGWDVWGVHRRDVSYGPGSYSEIDHHPLAGIKTIDDVLAHKWPDPNWYDVSVMPERIAAAHGDREYCIIIAMGNIFEPSWYMRGFEQMFMDLLTEPELSHAILEKVAEFQIKFFRQVLAASNGEIDLAFTADDIGSQTGPLMSLDMWEQFIKPYHARLNAVIHEFGVKVVYHTDGAVMEAVDGLIDMGIDVLQALQFDAAGMDPVALKENFGDRLCFQGGVSVQKTLPFGTVEDVRRETADRIAVLGKGGGYIMGPSHEIQAGTPPENIVAMFDTAASCPMSGG